jgi:aspartyl-tRNA(Asn)/glutamyl-tRNA(Gln) amidotransferase subunit A
LVSRFGAIANTSSLDQVGVITRDVRDCALVLNAIAGYDPQDGTSANIDVPDYTADLSGDIKGLRIAYPREYFRDNTDTAMVEQVKRALHEYEQLGAIVEEVSLPYSEYALPAYYIISRAEASTNLARYDGVQFGLRDLQADNIADLYANSRAVGFGNEVKLRILFGSYVLSADSYENYYLKAMKVRRLIHDDFTRVFENFDIIITPTTPTTAFHRDEFRGDLLSLYRNDILTVPVNMAGLPGMSVPCGFIDGLPAGMQLIGKPFHEKMLLNTALAYEQVHDYYKARPILGGDK